MIIKLKISLKRMSICKSIVQVEEDTYIYSDWSHTISIVLITYITRVLPDY